MSKLRTRSRIEALRARREALVRRSDLERRSLGATLGLVGASAERIDHGLDAASRVAKPPVLLLGALAAVVLLGRTRARRGLTAAVSIGGLLLRNRTVRDRLAGLLAGGHVVRRSR